MAHEGVELTAVGFLTEGLLHRAPVVGVEPVLVFGIEAHEDVIADQVGLGQLEPGRVHALEDELRVVLVSTQRDVHDDELGEPMAEGREVLAQPGNLLLEESKVLGDAD